MLIILFKEEEKVTIKYLKKKSYPFVEFSQEFEKQNFLKMCIFCEIFLVKLKIKNLKKKAKTKKKAIGYHPKGLRNLQFE